MVVKIRYFAKLREIIIIEGNLMVKGLISNFIIEINLISNFIVYFTQDSSIRDFFDNFSCFLNFYFGFMNFKNFGLLNLKIFLITQVTLIFASDFIQL